MSHNNLPQAITLVGPTASGKSGIAIELAKYLNGEIVSCDSRQIYRGMDIGTGKVKNDLAGISNFQFPISKHTEKNIFFSEGIRHWMIDIVSPNTPYNVAKFQKKANAAIKNILKRGKIPILCGGTGLWAQAVVENMLFPTVAPDITLRARLRNAPTEELFQTLFQIDPERTQTIDPKNRHRIIRAIELSRAQKTENNKQEVKNENTPSTSLLSSISHLTSLADWLVIAVNPPREILFEKIEKRLDERFKDGMIDEVAYLHQKQHVPWSRLDTFGLEYRWISRFLRKKITREEMREKLLIDIRHYAKRQLTWLRRWEKLGRKIHWISSAPEAETLIKNFLSKNNGR